MFKYLKKYLGFAILAPIFMIGEVLMDLLQPTYMSNIVDYGVREANMEVIFKTGGIMLLLVFFGGIFGILSGVFANLCSQNFSNDLRKDLFKKIMSLSLAQTDKFSTGSLITRVTNDVTQVQNLIGQIIRGFVRSMMFFVGGIVCMLLLDVSFGIVVACALPFVILIIIFFITKINPMFSKLQTKLDNLNSVMQENVSASRVVKAYVKEDYEKDRFNKRNEDLVNTQLKVLKTISFLTPLMNIILNLTVVIIIYTARIRIDASNNITPGNVMASITYVNYILNSMLMLAMLFQTLSRGFASMKRLNEVLSTTPDITCISGIYDLDEVGTVEFKNVSFGYNDNLILHDLSFKINKGETIGILGSTGCGKSSLISLIPRFYDTTSGEVLVDGKNVKDIDLHTLRSKIGIALQKSELFYASIKDNIKWGKEDATNEEIDEALKIAQAYDFVYAKEDKLLTLVEEKGSSLSGGQKQRLSIARAVIKKPEILIFDDSTSALDLKTEKQLYDALNEKLKDTTKIIIAQRISSIKDADKVIVLDNGKIESFDSPANLMKISPIYRDIYNSQIKEEDINA